MLEIGCTLNLQKIRNNQIDTSYTYYCKIIEKNNNYIWVDYPVNIETHRTSRFSEDTEIAISFVGNDNAVYSFQTALLRKEMLGNVPALLFPLPKTMKRVQRRDYVRVQTALDIAVHCTDEPPFTSVTKDISAGGVAIIVPTQETLTIHSLVNVYIALPMIQDKIIYIESKMKVIRKMYQPNIPTVSLQFIDLPNRFKEQIMQYCFKKQREQRIMELSK